MHPRRAAAACLAPVLAALLLAGCGGGVYLGLGDDFDSRPDVSVAASVDAARIGDTVRLVAAASDDFGIDRVEFFRIEADGSAVLLSSDSVPPYQVDTPLPATGQAMVSYFARATDDVGQHRDSAIVAVAVLP